MKQFRTVKRAVLPLLSMLVFALLSMGNMKHVEAATTEISIDINAEKGSSPTYGKTASQSVTRSGSWITLYQPNGYNYRIDYTANTTGKTRIGYVYVKEGSNTVKTYVITQSPSITVTYDKNGGSGSNLTRSVIYGKTYTKVDKPTKTGYDFIGWYTAKTGGSQVTETTIMRQTVNHTLYARWEPKSFTVTFKDGSTTVSTKTVTYDSTYGTLPTRTKTGYDLEGWFTASSGGSKVTDSATVKITSNQTLYAHWKLKSFTISFDSVGGSSVSPKTVTYNGYYSLPGNPTKTGYTFDGWYTTKDGGTKITSSTKVTITANQTLYAHWTANKYNVTFDKNGGSGTNLTRTIAFGNTYGKVDIPIRTGYDFIGWYTSKTGGSQVTETTTMSTAANHTVYARWEAKKSTVSFNSQGGSSVSSKTVTYNSTYGTLTTPVKANYTFLGWYTAASGGTQVTASTQVKITSSQRLYAHWAGDTYTVTYDKNGGDGDNLIRSIAYGSTYTKVDIPTRTGYSFDGWYKADGSQVTETTIMSTAENHTVYAHWKAKQYTVTFDDNYIHSNSTYIIVKKTVTYDSVYGTLDTPTREYYTFDGWYTEIYGGSKVTASTKVTSTADHTLYAHWIPNKYTVTYNMNGGDGSNVTRSISYNGTYGKIDNPTRTGYTFAGWYTEKTGGSQVAETTLMTTATDHTVFAHWTANSYTVTFDKNGGSGSNITRSIAFGSTYGKVDKPIKDGYTFIGWYTEKTGGSQVTETTLMKTAANHTVYARWDEGKYLVTYDINGGAGSNFTRTIAYGSTYGKVDIPTRTGYTFVGWYTEKTRGKQVVETTVMSTAADHILYAHWEPGNYIVFFDRNDGSLLTKSGTAGALDIIKGSSYISKLGTTVGSKTVTYGSPYGELPIPTREGYTFMGWYTEPNMTVARKVLVISATTKVTTAANHTLYAWWRANSYRVTYDLNGGVGDNYTRSVVYGSTYGNVDTPKKDGCVFDGWYTSPSGGKKVEKNTLMKTPKDHTLYARWKGVSFYVAFHEIGDTKDGIEYVEYTTNEDFEIKKLYFENEPFRVFKGWSKTKEAEIPQFIPNKCYDISELISLQILEERPTSTIYVHLYPVWIDTKLKVEYNWGNGAQEVWHYSEDELVTKGEVVYPETMNGRPFIGWSPSPEDHTFLFSEDNRLADVLPLMNMEKCTLYAVYGSLTEAQAYILDRKYRNPVWSDGVNLSIYIRKDNIVQLLEEISKWEGINDVKDMTSTDGYPMLDQIRNAIYYATTDYRLRDVCRWLNSKVEKIDKDGLLFLEIQIDQDGLRLGLSGIYENHVVPSNDRGEWYDLDFFSTDLPSYKKTELSQILTATPDKKPEETDFGNQGDKEDLKTTSNKKPEGTYFGNQGDYENDKEDPGAYDGLSFRSALKEILREGVRNTILEKINETLEYDEEMVELLTQYRVDLLDGGLCGQTAAVNLYLYFATGENKEITKKDFGKEMLEYFRMENGLVAWSEREATKGKNGHGGEGWVSICDYLNKKLKPFGKKAYAGIEGVQAGGSKKQLELTKQMISEGIPVIMSFASETEELRMLRMAENGEDLCVDTRNPVDSHYVIVTGVYESARGVSTYLKVASWGMEYYINWNEYVTKANRGIVGDAGCGYVVIK